MNQYSIELATEKAHRKLDDLKRNNATIGWDDFAVLVFAELSRKNDQPCPERPPSWGFGIMKQDLAAFKDAFFTN